MISVDTVMKANDLEFAFDRLAAATGEGMLRAGGYAGAELMRKQAAANVPVITGVLRDNIIVKRREEASSAAFRQVYIVTIRKGKVNEKGDAFYGQWVESGHRYVRPNPKQGKRANWKAHRAAALLEYGDSKRGAHPFLRPAWESLKGRVIDVMKKRMWEKMLELKGNAP